MKQLWYFIFIIFGTTSGFSSINEDFAEACFKKAPLYLVHLGFNHGLPEDGQIKPSSYDPALYFSLNTPFPKTRLMAKLDNAPYAVLMPFNNTMQTKTLSFHPTEVLIGDALIIGQNAYVIAPADRKIPQYYSDRTNLIRYHGKGIAARNEKTVEVLKQLGAFPFTITLDENQSWDNFSTVQTLIEGLPFNVNRIALYAGMLPQGIPYSCPAGSYDFLDDKWQPVAIGFLSHLKGLLSHEKKNDLYRTEILTIKGNLLNWVRQLEHLDQLVKENFSQRVEKMVDLKLNSGKCMIM